MVEAHNAIQEYAGAVSVGVLDKHITADDNTVLAFFPVGEIAALADAV